MKISHQYNLIVGALAQSGGSAAAVQTKLFETMPDLGNALRLINQDTLSDCSDDDGESYT